MNGTNNETVAMKDFGLEALANFSRFLNTTGYNTTTMMTETGNEKNIMIALVAGIMVVALLLVATLVICTRKRQTRNQSQQAESAKEEGEDVAMLKNGNATMNGTTHDEHIIVQEDAAILPPAANGNGTVANGGSPTKKPESTKL